MNITPYDKTKGPQPGITSGEPNGTYHALPDISHSKRVDFHDRPKKFEGLHITGELEKTQTEDMLLGSAFHCAVLEGAEEFANQYRVAPDLSYRSKDDKRHAVDVLNSMLVNPLPPSELDDLAGLKREDILDVFGTAEKAVELLQQTQYDKMTLLAGKVREDPLASALLNGNGHSEVVFRTGYNEELGFRLQCRVDYLNTEGCEASDGMSYSVDIKTIRDYALWQKEFETRKYYSAWPFYSKVMEITAGKQVVKRHFWIVVEKEWPYTVRVKEPDGDCWDLGISEIDVDLMRLSQCLKNGNFEDPGAGVIMPQGLSSYMLARGVE